MARKKRHKAELLREIRERVIEEDQRAREAAQRAQEEDAHLDALEEVTDLSRSRIERIAAQVESEHEARERRAAEVSRQRRRRMVGGAVAAAALLAIGVPIGLGVKRFRSEEMAAEELRSMSRQYEELVRAASAGNLEMMQYLVAEGAPVEVPGWVGESALMAATRGGHSGAVSWLLAQGSAVAYRDADGERAADVADEGSQIAVKQIIGDATAASTPADSPIRELWRRKILYAKRAFLEAVSKGQRDTVELFLAADDGVYAHDWEREGILEAATGGDVGVLSLFFASGRAESQPFLGEGLVRAAGNGNIAAIDFLLSKGADINHKPGERDQADTPLTAAIDEDSRVVEHLLEKGADPDKPGGYYGVPPIIHAILRSDSYQWQADAERSVRALLRHGADVNGKDDEGRLPIEVARGLRSDSATRNMVAILKAAGSEIPFTEDSFRALVDENDLNNIRAFLDRGVDPDLDGFSYNDPDRTALIHAAAAQKIEIVRALLEHGADPNIRTSRYGQTALLAAVTEENPALVKLLLSHGATVTDDVREVVREYSYTDYEPQDTIRALIL